MKKGVLKMLDDGANENTISKDDYNMMWKFLLDFIDNNSLNK